MSKTAGDVIAAKRKKFSLNQLEEITRKNRSSILRYQRNEARIPEEIAEKLARAFFMRESDMDAFISLCQRGYNLTEEKIKAAKRRRSERSRASREFRGEIRVGQVTTKSTVEVRADKMMFPSHKAITAGDIQFFVAIVSKKSGETVCALAPCEGITMHSGSGHMPCSAISPKDFLMFQSRRRPSLGRYSLLDIMKQTIEKSDVFTLGTDGTENLHERFVIISIADLDAERERLQSVSRHLDSADVSDTKDALDTTIAHIQFWKARPDDFKKRKKTLLREVDSYCRRIAALTSEL